MASGGTKEILCDADTRVMATVDKRSVHFYLMISLDSIIYGTAPARCGAAAALDCDTSHVIASFDPFAFRRRPLNQ